MKVQKQRLESNELMVPFKPLLHAPLARRMVVPGQEKAEINVVAPTLHSVELQRRRKQEARERKERERELRRRRQMQQPVHSID